MMNATNIDRLYRSRLYRLWSRLLTWFGDWMVRFDPPVIRAADIRALLAALTPGDVVCRMYDCYADGHAIPGHYTHSGIVVAPDAMIHAVAEGVCPIDPIDFVKDADGFVLLGPPYQTDALRQRAIDYAIAQIGKPYDFVFNSRDTRALYCHELTRNALWRGQVTILLTNPRRVLADDLLRACRTVLRCGE